MIGDAVAKEELAPFLLPSAVGPLTPDEVAGLWQLFAQIGKTWGADNDNPLYQRSQWLEFLAAKTEQEPPAEFSVIPGALKVVVGSEYTAEPEDSV